MPSLGIFIGQVIGAALKECGPQIVAILRDARRDTMEDGVVPAGFRDALLERMRKQDDLRESRGSGETPKNSEVGPGVGG